MRESRQQQRVRWSLDKEVVLAWHMFCVNEGVPVQKEIEKALRWWMELPVSMRERLAGSSLCRVKWTPRRVEANLPDSDRGTPTS